LLTPPSRHSTFVLALATLLGLVIALALAGCGAPNGSALLTVRTFPNEGITLSPPGSYAPAISSDAAYALCLNNVAACDESSPTMVELALLTDTGSNFAPPGTLVWAITWLGVTCHGSRGGPVVTPSTPPSESPVATATQLCDETAFVDAHSGAFLFTDTHPH
jgi:hypothetical protein